MNSTRNALLIWCAGKNGILKVFQRPHERNNFTRKEKFKVVKDIHKKIHADSALQIKNIQRSN